MPFHFSLPPQSRGFFRNILILLYHPPKILYKLEKYDLGNSLRLYQTGFRLIEVELFDLNISCYFQTEQKKASKYDVDFCLLKNVSSSLFMIHGMQFFSYNLNFMINSKISKKNIRSSGKYLPAHFIHRYNMT